MSTPNPRAVSEHQLTDFFAAMLGGEPFHNEGWENPQAQEKDDYIIMPSGYAIPTDYCRYYFSGAIQKGWGGNLSAVEYLMKNCAYGEQWVITYDQKSYDPRTNKVDTLVEGGGTGTPSPTLYPYYTF